MNDLAEVWHFTRRRLDQALEGLSDEQMRWRPHEDAHSIFEILYHIAGCEHYWSARIAGFDPESNDFEAKLDQAARDGFLRDAGCPFGPGSMNRTDALGALDFTFQRLKPIMECPTESQLTMCLISPVCDDVSGREGLARLAQHAGYHTGQIWLYRMDPRSPA